MPERKPDWAAGTWLITGASSGMGLALATAVARSGGTVIAATRRPEAIPALAADHPGRLIPFRLDAGDSAAVAEGIAEAERLAGPIDVLVNNAGYGLLGAVEETSDAEARDQLEVNFLAPAAIVRALLPVMRARGRGLIINITSVSGVLGQPGSAYYAASKFAMEGFSDALREEVSPFGIRVMLVEPGAVQTDFFGRSRRFAAKRLSDYAVVERRRQAETPDASKPGDPVRCAQAILAAIESAAPPERLALGSAAVDLIEDTLSRRLGEVRRLAELSRSADFEEKRDAAVRMTPQWARDRALFRFSRIDPARTALLAIDLQRGFFAPGAEAKDNWAASCADSVIPRVNRLARALRSAGGTVVFVRHTGSDDPALSVAEWQKDVPVLAALDRTMRPGTDAHALDPRLEVDRRDPIVDKYRYSAFIYESSDLQALLESRRIDTIIVTGAFTNFCCESTARDALMLGYRVVFVGDATLARTPQEQEMGLTAMQLAFADLRTTEEALALIAAAS